MSTFHTDVYGTTVEIPEDMGTPVKCLRCNGVYDLQAVTVTARYADCSMYRTPCCDKQVDDREWVSLPAFRRMVPR